MELESSAIAGMIIPDAMTPGQYYDGVRADDASARPIKRLMLAVLEDAMRCYQSYANSRNRALRRLFVEAEAWLMDRKSDGPFAFETVCGNLGIEPSCLREGLRRWRLQQLDGLNPPRLARRSPVTSVGRISTPLKRRRRKVSPAAATAAASDDSSSNVAAVAPSIFSLDFEHQGGVVASDGLAYDERREIESVNESSDLDTDAGIAAQAASMPVQIEVQEIGLA